MRSSGSRCARWLVFAISAIAALAVSVPSALAEITPTRDAMALAQAIADRAGIVTGASFVHIPPSGDPTAISTTALGEFPTSGDSYVILSSGNAAIADFPDTAGDSGTENAPVGTPPVRGARDVTTLKIDLDVPQNVSCLSLRFRFYSEEFPEWVGDEFNDAFIAELDQTTWDASGGASPTISAPDNFAFDTRGNPVTVNGIGDPAVAPAFSSGTTYDAASRRLRASTPVTPGPHSLYLTIFDQGDRIYDSAVFVDRLQLSNLNPCTRGAAADLSPGVPAGAQTLPNGRVSIPVESVFTPARLIVAHVKARPAILRSRDPFTFRVRVTDNRGFLIRNATVFVRSVPVSRLLPVQEVETNNRGIATFTLRPTQALPLRKRALLTLFVRARKEGATKLASVTGRRLVAVRLRAGGP